MPPIYVADFTLDYDSPIIKYLNSIPNSHKITQRQIATPNGSSVVRCIVLDAHGSCEGVAYTLIVVPGLLTAPGVFFFNFFTGSCLYYYNYSSR